MISQVPTVILTNNGHTDGGMWKKKARIGGESSDGPLSESPQAEKKRPLVAQGPESFIFDGNEIVTFL